MKINQIENPIGYQFDYLNASWVTECKTAKKQKAAQIIVALDKNLVQIIFDSGKDAEANSLAYRLPITLHPRTRYYWQVSVWNEKGDQTTSEISFFETGKMSEEWIGKWITPKLNESLHPLIRKEFSALPNVKQARVYTTGLGIYELEINGKKVGNEYLLPGLHAYDQWIQYQTYDVTNYLMPGENAIGAMLGNGWFKGRFGFDGGYENLYGDRFYFICELHILYEDGKEEVISTDDTWKSHQSHILSSGIYDGEEVDARLLQKKWSQPSFDDDNWVGTTIEAPKNANNLQERLSLPITIVEQLKPVEIVRTPKKETVLDFGQIITGWVSFKNNLPLGTKAKLTYGETLQEGNFYRDNLRTAKAEFSYVSAGNEELVRPHFTFYGFRYVKIEGIEHVRAEDFTACVVMSDIEQIGKITTSNSHVNKLIENALWSQKGNFLDVPTDCPQRDERMGWTGDAQIFSGTACFNMYSPAFFKKYMYDLNLEQNLLNGSVPNIVPRIKLSPEDGFIDGHGASPWGDAAVIIPWTLYLHYGDKDLLKKHYVGMKSWVDYISQQLKENGSGNLWLTGFHFADWLALDNVSNKHSPIGATDPYYIASVFYYYSTSILAKAARVLSFDEDASLYEKQSWNIRHDIQKEYFSSTGRTTIDTQTALVVALFFDLLPDDLTRRVKNDLVKKIIDNNIHLDTGFVGTPLICRALSKVGANDFAYRLLLNDDYPSWLYPVKMGATTIWERWDSILPDGKISGTGMNSLNHYVYGSIVEWLYRDVCGINPSDEFPGFKKANINPKPNGRLRTAQAIVNSASGEYLSSWEIGGDGRLIFKFIIPFNCEAEVMLPNAKDQRVISNIKLDRMEPTGDDVKIFLQTGEYEISYFPNVDYKAHYSLLDSLGGLLANTETRTILEKNVGLALQSENDMVQANNNTIAKNFFANYQLFKYYNPEILRELNQELETIEVPTK